MLSSRPVTWHKWLRQRCCGLQVRLSALQEANDALTTDAARVPERASEPTALGRSIQDAMAMLQDSPILRERSRNAANIRRLSPSGTPGSQVRR